MNFIAAIVFSLGFGTPAYANQVPPCPEGEYITEVQVDATKTDELAATLLNADKGYLSIEDLYGDAGELVLVVKVVNPTQEALSREALIEKAQPQLQDLAKSATRMTCNRRFQPF